MNMVVVRHPSSSEKYLFAVPDGVELEAGTLVNTMTRRGLQPGVCVTGTFAADPDVICKMWGTETNQMQRVVSVLREFMLEWPEITEKNVKIDDDDD